MNKIVHEHLKASELPERLREGIDAAATVTVIVQEESKGERLPRDELRRLLVEARHNASGISTDEAVARVRKLRDEWED